MADMRDIDLTGPDKNWPPKAGDVWEDAEGNAWMALSNGRVDPEVYLFRPELSSEGEIDCEVLANGGPLTLAYRWTRP